MRSPHLLVLAKSPVPGKVKTRLCPPCTPVEAADLAAAALADTLDAVGRCAASRRLLALDGAPGSWIPEGFEVFPQCSGSFNDRLAHAWAVAGGVGLQIGMDTPQVTPELLDTSLATLEDAGSRGAVLGAAEDGGWWALGLNGTYPAAFAGIEMSASTTGAQQRRRLLSYGLSVVELPVLVDVDVALDACRVAEIATTTHFAERVRALGLRERLESDEGVVRATA